MSVRDSTSYEEAEAPRSPRRFTVMLPIVRPPAMLPNAVRSVLAQTETDFELCIICDGAASETLASAEAMKREDPRIRVFAFAKGERHGEAHRAAVLGGSRAEFVAQIGDDDLWFPDHLVQLAHCLERADFVSLCQVRMHEGDNISVPPYGDLDEPLTRERMQKSKVNFFGPTEAGYRLSAYRTLPLGWTPAPLGLPTDLFMWRKFLAMPGLRFYSELAVTSLKFGAADWDEWPLERRAEIIGAYSKKFADPDARAALRRRALLQISKRMNRRQILRCFWRSPATGLPLAALRLRSKFERMSFDVGWRQ